MSYSSFRTSSLHVSLPAPDDPPHSQLCSLYFQSFSLALPMEVTHHSVNIPRQCPSPHTNDAKSRIDIVRTNISYPGDSPFHGLFNLAGIGCSCKYFQDVEAYRRGIDAIYFVNMYIESNA